MVQNVRSKAIITTGFPEVDNLLKTLEPKLQKKALRKGTRAGAKVVEQRARALVPHGDSGLLSETLTVRTAKVGPYFKKLKRSEIGHTVWHVQRGGDTGGEDDPFYSVFVEYGTKFFRGDPYIKPALFDSKPRVLAEVRKAIIAGVDEIARKAKKGKKI